MSYIPAEIWISIVKDLMRALSQIVLWQIVTQGNE